VLRGDVLKLLGSDALGIIEGLVATDAFGTSGGLGGRYLADQAKALTGRIRGLHLDRGSEDRFKQVGTLEGLRIRAIWLRLCFLYTAGHLVSRAI
jgi:hypothetical protein